MGKMHDMQRMSHAGRKRFTASTKICAVLDVERPTLAIREASLQLIISRLRR